MPKNIFSFSTPFAVAIRRKSLCSNTLRQTWARGFAVNAYAAMVYVKPFPLVGGVSP
jgi:hypothetical protein